MKIGDAHCHVNPLKGLGPEKLAKKFINVGGWFVGLVNLLSWNYNVDIASSDDFRKVYDYTVRSAAKMREMGLEVRVILGPHPAELTELIEKGVRKEKAYQLIIEAYDIAETFIKARKADGLGEAGRPHWNVSVDIIELSNQVMDYVLEKASDLDCIVHLHLERTTKETIKDVYERVRKTGAKKVVMHHIKGEYAGEAVQHGLYASVPAKKEELVKAIRYGPVFVVESDFLDDPRRPGAVVAPWSIGKTFKKLIENGLISDKAVEKILVDNIRSLYNI
ncbi:MAG: TatD family hydrolase [Thermoproteales archaeon]|nr:TatD family hydrolase [Thermoproteales archaeon]